MYTVLGGGGGGLGVRGSGPQTDKHLPQSPFTRKFFLMMTLCIAFYECYLSTLPPIVYEYKYRKQYYLLV
jgi:hypothetical protein